MSEAAKAVFLSYASQDAEAARRIAEALRGAGVEVWFDQNELVGGDAWDQKIRRQIKECALLIPVISQGTQSRTEGYFRLEWRLADQRTHLMAKGRPFLLPVVIDDTREAEAQVPDSFAEVQWTKAPGGEVPAAFVGRVRKLVGGEAADGAWRRDPVGTAGPKPPAAPRPARPWLLPMVAGGVAVGAVVLWQPWGERRPSGTGNGPPPATTAPILTEAQRQLQQARALIDGDLLAGRENFRLAEELSQRATALDPAEGEAWAVLARAQVEILTRNYESTPARREQVRIAVERARRLAPKAVESGLALAAYQEFGGQLADAERTARDVVAGFPGDTRGLMQLAGICHEMGKTTEAIELLHRAAALPGGAVAALTTEAAILRDQQRLVEAEAAVDRSLALAPSYRGYQMKLLLTAVDLGDLERALPVVEQLPAQLQQEDLFASLTARYWLWRGQPDRALEILRRVPRDFFEEQRQFLPKGWLTGWAQHAAGRPMAARAEWEQALAVVEKRLLADANRLGLVNYRARLLALVGRRAEAEAALQLAIELEGGSGDGRSGTEAGVRVCLGDHEAAIQGLLVSFRDRSLLRDRGAGTTLKYEPMWAPIRGDPRISQLIAENDGQLRRLKAGGRIGPDTAGGATPGPDQKSVAVLAFANLSGDKANEYFSDGISEELLNVLAKVPGLKVSARTSAFYFKGRDVPIPDIARQLGVAYVVEGSVRRQGDKVRITAQLIKAADGFHVWSDTFTRDLKDIFAVQDEIAGLIAQNLQLKLSGGAVARVVNPEAHRLVLEGRHYLALRGEANFAQSDAAFRAAVQIAPDLAVAHAGLAELVAQRGRYQEQAGTAPPGSHLAETQGHAARALQLDPTLSEPHAATAVALVDVGRLEEADAAMARALAANPNYGSLYLWQAHVHAARGRIDLALESLQRATDLDPLSFVSLYIRGAHLGYVGRFAEALPLLDRGAALRGERFLPLEGDRALARFMVGRREEAVTLARKILADPELIELGWWSIGEALWLLRQGGAEAEAVRQGEAILSRLAPDNYLHGYVLCCLGRFEEGLLLMRNVPTIARNRFLYVPIFDPVRETPAFRQWIAAMKVEAGYAAARATLAKLQAEAKP